MSTMLYFLALQATAACPFHVIKLYDGLDYMYQRHIFNLIIKSASQLQSLLKQKEGELASSQIGNTVSAWPASSLY